MQGKGEHTIKHIWALLIAFVLLVVGLGPLGQSFTFGGSLVYAQEDEDRIYLPLVLGGVLRPAESLTRTPDVWLPTPVPYPTPTGKPAPHDTPTPALLPESAGTMRATSTPTQAPTSNSMPAPALSATDGPPPNPTPTGRTDATLGPVSEPTLVLPTPAKNLTSEPVTLLATEDF